MLCVSQFRGSRVGGEAWLACEDRLQLGVCALVIASEHAFVVELPG